MTNVVSSSMPNTETFPDDLESEIERLKKRDARLQLIHVALKCKLESRATLLKEILYDMLKETYWYVNSSQRVFSLACERCFRLLKHNLIIAAASLSLEEEVDDEVGVQIAKQSDNLVWLLDIMIDGDIADYFLVTWASRTDLSDAHSKLPTCHRYYVSRVTARLFARIGEGRLTSSSSRDAMRGLVKTWLMPFCDDYGLMKESKCIEWGLMGEGLSIAVLTLPLSCQQEVLVILVELYEKYSSTYGCPNIQTALENWWRKASMQH